MKRIAFVVYLLLSAPMHGAAHIDDKSEDIDSLLFNSTDWFNAIEFNNIEDISLMISYKYIDINTKNIHGNTALHLAATYGHKKLVELLIENNANLSLGNSEGKTALELAKNIGNVEIVEILTQRIAIVNEPKDKTQSTLILSTLLNLGKKRKSMDTELHTTEPDITDDQSLAKKKLKQLFKCDLCGYASQRKYHLVRHKKTHSDERPFKCDLCEFASKIRSNLTGHKKIHSDEKPFKCDLCEHASKTKSDLNQHKKTHSNEKPFKCDLCEFTTKTKSYLTNHKKTHNEKIFKCDLCEFATKTKSYLTNHKKTHHDANAFKCDLCEFETKTKSYLTNHKKTHQDANAFKCDLCEFAAKYKESLVRHKEAHNWFNAIISSNMDVINNLVLDININIKDKNGNTALHLAVLNNHKDLVILLIMNKADLYLLNNNKETPKHIAEKSGNKEILEIIKKAKEQEQKKL